INDPRGLAPIGWHIPTNDEFTTLSACLGGDVAAGGKMKSEGTIEAGTGLWKAPNTDATNSTGFTALPGGSRSYFFGTDFNIGVSGFWWSSSERDFGNAWYRAMFYNLSGFARGSGIKQTGYSVRCVRD
ncbi:MAG TPA: fibrobacter succinogenes major paralogous domain-containing protein, partial [Chitinophagaceae bacterium]|nr:fibrobacter succinogenes major paralogous domain-containing protein [Chitinophagaceae bacterium]